MTKVVAKCVACGREFIWVAPTQKTDPYPPMNSKSRIACGGKIEPVEMWADGV